MKGNNPYLVALCVAFLYSLVQHPVGAPAGQELFGFPADDEEVSAYLQNADNRTPVYIPGKCAKDEILYPGDQATSWVCDCRPGHVYYPLKDACYALYTKGFCQDGQYVDLDRPSVIVTCTNNTCPGANQVPFRGECAELDQYDQRCPKKYIIGVNTTTLELDCIRSGKILSMRFDTSKFLLFADAKRCSNGTKATHDGQCA